MSLLDFCLGNGSHCPSETPDGVFTWDILLSLESFLSFGVVTGRSKSTGIKAESSCPATSRGERPYFSCAVCHVKTPFVHVILVRSTTASSSSVGGRRSTKNLIC